MIDENKFDGEIKRGLLRTHLQANYLVEEERDRQNEDRNSYFITIKLNVSTS